MVEFGCLYLPKNILSENTGNPGPRHLVGFSGARAMGAVGATAPVAQTVRGQHGGNRQVALLTEICALFTGIGIYNYF